MFMYSVHDYAMEQIPMIVQWVSISTGFIKLSLFQLFIVLLHLRHLRKMKGRKHTTVLYFLNLNLSLDYDL